MQVIRDSGLH